MGRKFLIALFTLLLMQGVSFANLYQMYGPDSEQIALAGQVSDNITQAANQYYSSALMSFSEKTSFSLSSIAIAPRLKKINNIVVSSPINSDSSNEEYGDANNDYGDSYMLTLHASFKILPIKNIKFNFSGTTPSDKFAEASTGDFWRPEYVMYRSRVKRALFLMSLSTQLTPRLTFSLGTAIGVKGAGEFYVVARENGSPSPSSGKMKFVAKPTSALNVSLAYQWGPKHLSFFSYQDEMKSELETQASGITPVGASSLKFQWQINSLLYYDPKIYRLTHLIKEANKSYHLSLEYQDWSGYKTPKLHFTNTGGILTSSIDYEELKTKNILIPKLGMISRLNENHDLLFGLAYHPSPLDNNLSKSGNTIDLNKNVLGLGHRFRFKLEQIPFHLVTSLQYHKLEDKQVYKTSGRENGDSGEKIGAPGYKAGGEIYILALAMNWTI